MARAQKDSHTVIVSVVGGVASLVHAPEGIMVVVRDYDGDLEESAPGMYQDQMDNWYREFVIY